jgi:hypothetical protein
MDDQDIDNVISILNKFQENLPQLDVPCTSYRQLFKVLDHEEIRLIQSLTSTSADEAGNVRLPRCMLVTPAKDDNSKQFVRVSEQLDAQFRMMSRQLIKETGQELYICSGYRSPAYQTLIFLRELYVSNYDLSKAQTVAKLPAESQHARYPLHAIDVSLLSNTASAKEINDRFEQTIAYHWLTDNARNFGFSLSYPRQNDTHTIFEPWHWLCTGI